MQMGLIRSNSENYTSFKYSIKKLKNRTGFGTALLTIFLACSASDANVSVIAQTGMTCPGYEGGGITIHTTGAFGGFPNDGSGTHPMDQYSVEQINSQWKCFNDEFIGQWSCTWEVSQRDFTYYETGVNSYLTNTNTYFNLENPGIVRTTAANTWGLGWYHSYNQDVEYVSDWDYELDHCLGL